MADKRREPSIDGATNSPPDNAAASSDTSAMQLYKRARTEQQQLVVAAQSQQQQLIPHALSAPPRTSHLQAPTMCLTGHKAAVYTAKFNPDGTQLASGAADNLICHNNESISFLWEVYGECRNTAVFKGHSGAVLSLCWSSSADHLYSCSVDHTAGIWDTETQQRIKKLKHHHNIVNAVSASQSQPSLFTTVGNDGALFLYDSRTPKHAMLHYIHPHPLLAVALADTQYQVYTSGIDPHILCIDYRYQQQQQLQRQTSSRRKQQQQPDRQSREVTGVLYTMQGHAETVTGLDVNPQQTMLLSNGQDCVVHCWDIQPYIPQQQQQPHHTSATQQRDPRWLQSYVGAVHDMEQNLLRVAWSPDSTLVTAGSADRHVYVWDSQTALLRYRLPGHKGSVNEVRLHPNEPIIVSAGSDKQIFLGEL